VFSSKLVVLPGDNIIRMMQTCETRGGASASTLRGDGLWFTKAYTPSALILMHITVSVIVQFCENLKSIHTSIRALRYSARTDFRSFNSRLISFVPAALSLSTFNYQLSTFNYQLSTINYPLSTIHYSPEFRIASNYYLRGD